MTEENEEQTGDYIQKPEPLPAPFRLVNGKSAKEILERNSTEYMRWCFTQALTQNHTKLGEKVALLLAKAVIDGASEPNEESTRFFRNLARVPIELLRKFEAGEIDPNDIKLSASGEYEVIEADPTPEPEPTSRPVKVQAGRPNESQRPSNWAEK